MEFLELFKNELIITATLSIVELLKKYEILKDKKLLGKISLDDYKLVSLLISVVLIIIVKNFAIEEETLMVIENAFILILPSLGYDYLYNPLIKPILKLIKK
jgi:hypothetical protein